MSTITLNDIVTYTDGSTSSVSIDVSKDGCIVKHLDTTTELSWLYMEDVGHLAEAFADTTVRSFKVIVPLVAKAVQLKDIVC